MYIKSLEYLLCSKCHLKNQFLINCSLFRISSLNHFRNVSCNNFIKVWLHHLTFFLLSLKIIRLILLHWLLLFFKVIFLNRLLFFSIILLSWLLFFRVILLHRLLFINVNLLHWLLLNRVILLYWLQFLFLLIIIFNN